MNYQNNIPLIEQGLEVSRLSFTGGRIGVDMTEKGGITRVMYFGRQHLAAHDLFKSNDPIASFTKIFRPYLAIGDKTYYLEFNHTRIYPFGYQSEFSIGGVKVRHEMILLNDTITFRMTVLENRNSLKIKLRVALCEYTRVALPLRKWSAFEIHPRQNFAKIKVSDKAPPSKVPKDDFMQKGTDRSQEPDGETIIGVSSNTTMKFREAGKKFKLYAETAEIRKSAVTFVLFAPSAHEFINRLQILRKGVNDEIDAALNDFEKRKKRQPAIEVNNKEVQSFLMMAPAMLDAMKIKDIPGAIRAANSGYWVWGWDSMVHSDALMLWNDGQAVKEMLEFYRKTADLKWGISHLLNLELKNSHTLPVPAQLLYNVMLYNYYLSTGDKGTVREYFPFARATLERSISKEVGDTGLIKSVAYYPDTPDDLEQDGNDICIINNSIFYQGLRAMGMLALETGEKAYAGKLEDLAGRCRRSFIRCFYDSEKGYFIDSVSARDFAQRKHYPLYAILWVTSFADELIPDGKLHVIADFMEKNFPAGYGLSMFPKWDRCFYLEGSQLGMYMPVIERFYREVMKISKKTGAPQTWFDTVGWFWRQHTVPEALACEAENESLSLDNPGREQAFSVKSWYGIFIHVMAGIGLDCKGIRFSPASGSAEIKITGLKIRGKVFDLHISGKGQGIESMVVNGKTMDSANCLPFAALRTKNTVMIKRG